MKLEIMGEEEEEFGDPLGIVATIRSKLTLSACKLHASNCSKTDMDLTAPSFAGAL